MLIIQCSSLTATFLERSPSSTVASVTAPLPPAHELSVTFLSGVLAELCGALAPAAVCGLG